MSSTTPGEFRRGIRIGIDVGSVRVGVARTDPDGTLAVPVATLARPKAVAAPRTDLTGIADLVEEYEPLEVVVGLPLTLDGLEGPAASAVRAYVHDLVAVLRERGCLVPVRLVDERLSTAAAAEGCRRRPRRAEQPSRGRPGRGCHHRPRPRSTPSAPPVPRRAP